MKLSTGSGGEERTLIGKDDGFTLCIAHWTVWGRLDYVLRSIIEGAGYVGLW